MTDAGTRDVAVGIVTRHDAADLPGCLAALAASEPPPHEVIVVDNASDDDSAALARAWTGRPAGCRLEVVELGTNTGFAHGMNVALAHSTAPWLLTLNADARPAPDALATLRARAEAHPHLAVGAVTGRLTRPPGDDGTRRLDACGMYWTRTWRHLDRGSGEEDRGQYSEPQRVFGGTGAATLFRRAALEDAAVGGEVFDPRFHSFREDAELAFRLRERGWEVLYEPAAAVEHRRRVTPARRRDLPPPVNYHSLKNRYLLRCYHQTAGNLLRTLVPTLARDLGALAYALAFERTSLPAYGWLWRHRRELWARRRQIQGRRTAPPADLDAWFRHDHLPLPDGPG
jgi:GT2 family glycosyltransferase